MDDFETRRVVKVFLASPGGVPEERELTKEVVDSLNLSCRNFNWLIELRRWEDTTPGYGRPQSLINPDVEDCDLFVAILFDRLGSNAGRRKTGFEEEMALALKRRKNSERPEISLFVKDVDKARLNDPGPELAKVLEYLAKIKKNRKVLYKPYKEESDYYKLLHSTITSYLLKCIADSTSSGRLSDANSALPPPPALNPLAITHEDRAREPGFGQIHEVLARFTKLVEAVIKPEVSTDGSDIANRDISRLQLLSSSILSARKRAGLMGVHEINLLYLSRKSTSLIAYEREYVLRSMLADTSSSKPGWVLLSGENGPLHMGELFYLAAWDSDSDVRYGTLKVLAESGVDFVAASDQRPSFLLTIMSDKELRSNKPAITVAARIGKIDDIPFLDEEIAARSDKYISDIWARVKFCILAPSDPDRAFELIREHAFSVSTDGEIIAFMNDHLCKISRSHLEAALEAEGTSAQGLAVSELIRRGALSDHYMDALIRSTYSDIKEQIVRELIRLGRPIDSDQLDLSLELKQTLEIEKLRSKTAEELMEHISWYNAEGVAEYSYLANAHYEKWAPTLRRDLRDNFQYYRDRSSESFRAKYKYISGQDKSELLALIEDVIARHDSPDALEYYRWNHAQIALTALTEHVRAEDAEIARMYLVKDGIYSHQYRLLAAKILEKVGNRSDAETIFDAMSGTYGATKSALSQSALFLSPGVDGIAWKFLDSGDPDLIQAAVVAIAVEDNPDYRKFFTEKLGDKSMEIRKAALSYLSQVCTSDELEQTLNSYILQESYFYNVVTWIDRILWAPSPLASFYRRTLTTYRPRHEFSAFID